MIIYKDTVCGDGPRLNLVEELEQIQGGVRGEVGDRDIVVTALTGGQLIVSLYEIHFSISICVTESVDVVYNYIPAVPNSTSPTRSLPPANIYTARNKPLTVNDIMECVFSTNPETYTFQLGM